MYKLMLMGTHVRLFMVVSDCTLPETNIAPENGGFQYESPFPGVYFQGLC